MSPIRPLLRGVLLLFLLFPFFFLICLYHLSWHLDWADVRWAAGNSFLQAFGSATTSLILGFWGALGLMNFTPTDGRPWRGLLELSLLLPNFFPVLFLLLAAMNLLDPFPMGISGIVVVHTLMNWGLAAVLLASLIESRMGHLAELAFVEGSSRARFLLQGVLPMIAKEAALIWVFIFSVSFGSFAVPLMVGGSRGTTLEVLIFEKIRLQADWGQAVAIALMQSGFLFLLGCLAAQQRSRGVRSPYAPTPLLRWRSGVLLIVFMTGLLLLGYLQGLPAGWRQIHQFSGWGNDLLWGFLGSLRLGFGAAALCLVLLVLSALVFPSRWFEKFLSGYVAPSSALTAFAFLVLGPNEDSWAYLKISAALALIVFPGLWRMGWQGGLEQLRTQRDVARLLGASEWQIWIQISWPQLSDLAGTLAGLAAVWACGDFAVSRILAHRDLTLGLMTETLITSGYRLGLATILSLGVGLASLVCFLAVKGGVRVCGRTSKL